MNTQYSNFINSIKSKESRAKYEVNLKDYERFVGKSFNIYKEKNVKKIQQKIIDYTNDLKQKVSYATIHNRLSAVHKFYMMSDIVLNKTKLNQFKPENRRVDKDRPYSRQELQQLLAVSEPRMKVCIGLMASAGLRVGAIPDLKLKHLEKLDSGSYKISAVYENSKEEYYTFCTPEVASFIDQYLKERERIGEKLTRESWLIRDHFDSYKPRVEGRQITKSTIRETINKLLVKSGTRAVHEIHLTHGFRKFHSTQLVKSGLSTEYRWLLQGHKFKGNDQSYVKISENVEEMYAEFSKAINNLTINDENRLKEEVKVLRVENSQYQQLKNQFEAFKSEVLKLQKKK